MFHFVVITWIQTKTQNIVLWQKKRNFFRILVRFVKRFQRIFKQFNCKEPSNVQFISPYPANVSCDRKVKEKSNNWSAKLCSIILIKIRSFLLCSWLIFVYYFFLFHYIWVESVWSLNELCCFNDSFIWYLSVSMIFLILICQNTWLFIQMFSNNKAKCKIFFPFLAVISHNH